MEMVQDLYSTNLMLNAFNMGMARQLLYTTYSIMGMVQVQGGYMDQKVKIPKLENMILTTQQHPEAGKVEINKFSKIISYQRLSILEDHLLIMKMWLKYENKILSYYFD